MKHVFLDFDKAGAEWVVVAYLSGDGRMIDVVESGQSPHPITGSLMTRVPVETIVKEEAIVGKLTDATEILRLRKEHFPELFTGDYFLPRTMSIRQCGKKSNHGLNYDEGYRQFALINEMEEKEAKTIVDLYKTVAYPGIPVWHESIRRQLRENRTLINCFGRKRRFLEPWGNDLFKAAYAQLPQSTVVDMVNLGMVSAFKDDSEPFQAASLMQQVHDSLVYCYPPVFEQMALFCIKQSFEYMSPLCSYSGREFKVKTDLKMGLRLGEDDLVKVKLTENVDKMVENLKEAWEKINDTSKETP